MTTNNAHCLICGEPLTYSDSAISVTCHKCGKRETGHSLCKKGHYICDTCHRTEGVQLILKTCKKTNYVDPIKLAQQIMLDKAIYPNGPEHHTLIGAVLLACFKNAGGEIDLEKSLDELFSRSMQIPGGTCGYWGCCGAAMSAGQYWSIISGTTPLTQESWADGARLTSRIMNRLADIGGVRCCKRTGFTAIEEAARYTAKKTGITMDLPEKTICIFTSGNAQCLRRDCPYFPTKD